MFDITPTEEIKISRGDASGSFSLDVNLGTELKPLLFKFYKACFCRLPIDVAVFILRYRDLLLESFQNALLC